MTFELAGMGVATQKRTWIGALLCLCAIVLIAVGWFWALSGGSSTDNAYVRGDVTSLAPKISGYVTSVEVEDNQPVSTGDVLFRIDDRDYRARLAQAEANVHAAKAQLTNIDGEAALQQSIILQAKAQHRSSIAEFELATKANDRRHSLILSKAVSQAQVDESDATRTRAEAGVAAASASLKAQQQRVAVLAAQREAAIAALDQAKATRDLARIDLDSTVVRAPIGGVVGNRQVRIGRFVVPGTPLLDIVPVNDVWIVANFKETQIANIRPGQRVRIAIDGYPAYSLDGVVDSFAPGSGSAFSLLPSDNATGNFVRVVQRVPVKIRLLNNPLPGRIVPGLSARVELIHVRGI
jgi:membrane fusion protein (multidrug efflux system)